MRFLLTIAAVLALSSVGFGQCANGQCAAPSSGFHPFGSRIAGVFMSGDVGPRREFHLPHPVMHFIEKHQERKAARQNPFVK